MINMCHLSLYNVINLAMNFPNNSWLRISCGPDLAHIWRIHWTGTGQTWSWVICPLVSCVLYTCDICVSLSFIIPPLLLLLLLLHTICHISVQFLGFGIMFQFSSKSLKPSTSSNASTQPQLSLIVIWLKSLEEKVILALSPHSHKLTWVDVYWSVG